MNGLIRWLWPLLATTLTIFAVSRLFLHVNFTNSGDTALLLFIGFVFLFAAAVLVIFTRRWELRGLGQVVTYLADAMLYGGAGLARLGAWGGLAGNEAGIALMRAMFVVGGVFLVVGVVKHLLTEYRNDDEM